MNTIKKTIRNSALGFATTLLVANPLWADDTEIFFGGTSNTTVRPNIMFILDTSGSMTGKDGGSIQRIDRMKNALTNLLTSVKDVNVGLMRFTNPGGPVLYPIRYVDDVANPLTITIDGTVSSTVNESSDDAYEIANNTMSLSTDVLITESGGNAVVEQTTQNSSDDAEENVSGNSVDVYSSDLDMMHSRSGEKMIGIRMRSLNIPKSASITNAYLEFEVRDQKSGDITVEIYGHDRNSSGKFEEEKWNISSRTLTTAKVEWDIPNPSDGTKVQTPDISSIVQEIVNRGGWKSQNHMSFIIKYKSRSSGAKREFDSHDGDNGATKLHVTYNDGSSAAATKIGLRFNEIAIPQGATVTSAKLNLTPSTSSSDSTSITIYGEDADHSEQYSSTAGDISTRTKTSASVGWTTIPAWTAGTAVSSPDLTSVIQEIVDRSGWCGNNSLAFILEPSSGERAITSFDENLDSAPELEITFDTSSVSSSDCINYKTETLIAENNDDAEQKSNGEMQRSSNDLDLGEKTVGLRYTGLPFTQGSTINYAYLEFVSDGADSGSTPLTIYAHDNSNSGAFTSSWNNISNRTKTSASISWTPGNWTSEGQVVRSPNIAPLINEVLSNSSWASGNALSFIIEGSGHRRAKSANGSNLPPKLVYFANEGTVTSLGTTVRQELISSVQELPADGYTPIVDTLYEARQYFTGGDVIYGKTRGDGGSKHKKRVSDPSTYSGGTLVQPSGCTSANLNDSDCSGEYISGSPKYISPVTHSCQQNHIVLLTDGQANSNHSETIIKTLLNKSECESSASGEKCGLDLVRYMSDDTNDQIGTLSGNQIINTHVIGLEISTNWLNQLADAGGGEFKLASSEQDILDVFDKVVSEILADTSTFVEPSVTVNQFNRFAHRDDIYFAVFEPSSSTQWPGNIKKYQLKGNPADIYDNSNPQQEAIDVDSGFFANTSKSFWSEDVDGKDAANGGVANELPASRVILTNIDTTDTSLNVGANQIDSSNTSLTKALLDIESETDSYRDNLISWAKGLDENDANRYQIGDPLHSRPELITHDAYTNPITSYIFTGTNEGYLHAFDINTGIEKFAFIPKELLPNLKDFYENDPSDPTSNPRPYGLDGGLTVWTRDLNYDGDIADSDEFARLYVGMRRGGRNYYALDVTNMDYPKQMWQITGGSGDFVDLGQTWSEPVKTKVSFDGTIYDVLIFAGGYDEDQDTATTRTTDNVGNAIYIVNAETGALLWSGGNHNGHDEVFSAMDYSIPSDITVLDMNSDGLADQMYVGDMGGQVWRFDINNEETQLNKFVDGGVIADIADSTTAGNRRFFYRPDVALIVNSDGRFLSVSIGSGFRANPLNTAIEDRFYMIKQFDTHGKPSSYTTHTEASLYDATNNLLQEGTADEQALAELELSSADNQQSLSHPDVKYGWFLKMENSGEKVLASSATIMNQIAFTSYEPSAPSAATCEPKHGTNRIYVVDAAFGTPLIDTNNDGTIDKADRVTQLKTGSIASTPTVIDTIDSKPTVWVGTERIDNINTDVDSVRTYWIEESSQ